MIGINFAKKLQAVFWFVDKISLLYCFLDRWGRCAVLTTLVGWKRRGEARTGSLFLH